MGRGRGWQRPGVGRRLGRGMGFWRGKRGGGDREGYTGRVTLGGLHWEGGNGDGAMGRRSREVQWEGGKGSKGEGEFHRWM